MPLRVPRRWSRPRLRSMRLRRSALRAMPGSDPPDLDDGAAQLAPAPAQQEGQQEQQDEPDDPGGDGRGAGGGDLVAGAALQLPELGLEIVPADAVVGGVCGCHGCHLFRCFCCLRRTAPMRRAAVSTIANAVTTTIRYGYQDRSPAKKSPVSVCRALRAASRSITTPKAPGRGR